MTRRIRRIDEEDEEDERWLEQHVVMNPYRLVL